MSDYYKRYIKLDNKQIRELSQQVKLEEEFKNIHNVKSSALANSLTNKLQGSDLNKLRFFNRLRDKLFRKKSVGKVSHTVEIYDVIVYSQRRLEILTDSGKPYLLEVSDKF